MRGWVLTTGLLLAHALHAAHAASWPRLEGGAGSPACTEALQLADRAFRGDAPTAWMPDKLPEDTASAYAAGLDEPGMPGGMVVGGDPAWFDRVVNPAWQRQYFLWQKQAVSGWRLVMQESHTGWRGETYDLLALDEGVTPAQLFAVLGTLEQRSGSKPFAFDTLIERTWTAPRVLRHRTSGQFWIVALSDGVLPAWSVHEQGPGGIAQTCRVSMGRDFASAAELLPPQLRRLARLLDGTMGPGHDEGTLHSTARRRFKVQKAWANAMLRPWAWDEPYNTRQEVDAGLRDWATVNRARRRLYEDIRRSLPRAQRELARHYRVHFGRPAAEARACAAFVLDAVLRAHYAFHSEDAWSRGRSSIQHPWRGN